MQRGQTARKRGDVELLREDHMPRLGDYVAQRRVVDQSRNGVGEGVRVTNRDE